MDVALLYSRSQVGLTVQWMVLNVNSMIQYYYKRKMILSGDGLSVWDIVPKLYFYYIDLTNKIV